MLTFMCSPPIVCVISDVLLPLCTWFGAQNGLNRHFFTPFIGLLKSHCKVLDMASPTDHRLQVSNARQHTDTCDRSSLQWEKLHAPVVECA